MSKNGMYCAVSTYIRNSVSRLVIWRREKKRTNGFYWRWPANVTNIIQHSKWPIRMMKGTKQKKKKKYAHTHQSHAWNTAQSHYITVEICDCLQRKQIIIRIR